MNKLIVPYHLILPACICIVALLVILFFRKKLFTQGLRKRIWISVTIFFIVYLYVVGSAGVRDMYYQWDLYSFDLNKNGIFDSEEITSKQELAMKRLISDVGRDYSYITGLIIALVGAAIVFVFTSLSPKSPKP